MADDSLKYLRSPEMASAGDSRLLVVDVQEKLLPLIDEGGRVERQCRRIVEGARALEVPVFATEQYPKGLGRTVSQLRELIDDFSEKRRFSSLEVLGWEVQSSERTNIILAGIEAHVCIQQTALDLLAAGFRVFVLADAIGSRNPVDAQLAIERMSTSGVVITTTEAMLFEWCETADSAAFPAIRNLVIES